MTRRTNERLAGVAFLVYIALGIGAMMLSGRAGRGEGIAAQLASFARHAADVRAAAVLNLLSAFAALVLGVTLYAITRDEDHDLAMLGFTFRVGEGVLGGLSIQRSLGLLWLSNAGRDALDPRAMQALAAFQFHGQAGGIGAAFFAAGSLIFSWLLLRGRMIPTALAGLGVLASALWVIAVPLQVVGLLRGTVLQLLYAPMAVFEVPLALWLLVRGTKAPERSLQV
ncbi:MAG TPA: DUF4386 domain-containing protein [Candidatus Eisenbacteria bacterium]|nr:DUF4386 domain-containing protein [Candidatus Eisenbacteria bacterium]